MSDIVEKDDGNFEARVNEKLDDLQLIVYRKGFIDGLTTFAWNKDGKQYCGTSSQMLLSEAIAKIETLWNWEPPKGDVARNIEGFAARAGADLDIAHLVGQGPWKGPKIEFIAPGPGKIGPNDDFDDNGEGPSSQDDRDKREEPEATVIKDGARSTEQ